MRRGSRSRCAERQESLRRGGMSRCAGRRAGRQEPVLGWGRQPPRQNCWFGQHDPLHLVAGACAGAAGGAWPKLVIAGRRRCGWWQETLPGGRGLFAGDRAEAVAVEMVEDQDETWLAENRLVHDDPESRLPVWTYPFVLLGTHCAVEQCWTARPYSATCEVPGTR